MEMSREAQLERESTYWKLKSVELQNLESMSVGGLRYALLVLCIFMCYCLICLLCKMIEEFTGFIVRVEDGCTRSSKRKFQTSPLLCSSNI